MCFVFSNLCTTLFFVESHELAKAFWTAVHSNIVKKITEHNCSFVDFWLFVFSPILQIRNAHTRLNDLRGSGGVTDAGVTPAIIGGAPVLGRTFTASVKYKF